MNYLRKLEKTLEGLIEGKLTGTFHEKLHPMEIGRLLSHSMKERKQNVESAVYVPNHYSLRLSEEDYVQFRQIADTLQRDLAQFLSLEADDLDVNFMGPLSIELEKDPSLARGEVAIECAFMMEERGGKGRIKGALIIKEGFGRGSVFYLTGGKKSLGRNEDNDIVISDPKISGIHCTIEWREGHPVIIDSSSRNGLMVNRKTVEECALNDRDEIQIGFSTVQFRSFQ